MTFRLTENGGAAEATLDAETAMALHQSGLVEVSPAGPGRWSVRPVPMMVGAVRTGRTEVVVEPKTGVARLLFLLGYAANPGFRSEDVEGTADLDPLTGAAEALSQQVTRALRQGVLQGYVTREEALTVIRGRPRLADQWSRRPLLPIPVEVTHDDYSPDITENRILRAALRRAAAIPRLRSETRSRLLHLDSRLGGVTSLVPGALIPSWHETRLNRRYAAALRLAELVLRNQSVETRPGQTPIAAFVANMPAVFEDFVTTALAEALSHRPGYTATQYSTYLDKGRRIPLRPDLLHLTGNHPILVADAKYKTNTHSDDHQQMLAYCTTFALKRGWLIYAYGPASVTHHHIRNSDITITSIALNLTAPPSELLAQLAALAHKMWDESE
jgi:5-methylcytosine-specific restriction enzyme subunit McrC